MQGKRYGDGKILKYDDVSEKIITEMFINTLLIISS